MMKTMEWKEQTLYLLDQTKLPEQVTYIACKTWQEVYDAIACLVVRGAPAIGIAAAYGVVLGAYTTYQEQQSNESAVFIQAVCDIGKTLDRARPTAVNLHWAIMRMLDCAVHQQDHAVDAIIKELEKLAIQIHQEDVLLNKQLSMVGTQELSKIGKPLTILTHCNAGALATAAIGTALGVIRGLHQKGFIHMVYADETRPLLQGARLTVTELMEEHIPVTLITDNMAAWTMAQKKVDAVIVGADRIAANGDTANKVGTYGLSLLAHYHHIPFYVAAPISTFDRTIATGKEIPIEERAEDEVRCFNGNYCTPKQALVFNPAFDVTPHEHITGIFTEYGFISKPDMITVSSFFIENNIKE